MRQYTTFPASKYPQFHYYYYFFFCIVFPCVYFKVVHYTINTTSSPQFDTPFVGLFQKILFYAWMPFGGYDLVVYAVHFSSGGIWQHFFNTESITGLTLFNLSQFWSEDWTFLELSLQWWTFLELSLQWKYYVIFPNLLIDMILLGGWNHLTKYEDFSMCSWKCEGVSSYGQGRNIFVSKTSY